VCDGKVKDSRYDKSVFAVDCSSNRRGSLFWSGGAHVLWEGLLEGV
jgi:hypothetical protein